MSLVSTTNSAPSFSQTKAKQIKNGGEKSLPRSKNMGCSQSIAAAIADTSASRGLKERVGFPESVSVTTNQSGSNTSSSNRTGIHRAAAEETVASGLTRGNSSDSLPSNCTSTNNGLNTSGATAAADGGTPLSIDEKQIQHFDVASTESLSQQLKDRSLALFGQSPLASNKDDAEDDPFADDCSAVFDVDENFLLDDDNLSTASHDVLQEALRGLTLEAQMSLVELVRSNSVGQLTSLTA